MPTVKDLMEKLSQYEQDRDVEFIVGKREFYTPKVLEGEIVTSGEVGVYVYLEKIDE